MASNDLITLKLIGFDEITRNNFQAILGLATRALQKKWQIVTNNEADFFLFSVDVDKNPDLYPELKTSPSHRRLFCSQSKQIQSDHHLYVDSKHLPSLSSLVTLFNQLDTNDGVETPDISPPFSSPADLPSQTVATPYFDTQTGLLGRLLTATDKLLCVSLQTNPTYPALYINAEKSVYYSQNVLEQLSPYLQEEITIKASTLNEITDYATANTLKPQPLKGLIWYLVIKTSEGKTLKDYEKSDIVTLKGWPDLKFFKCLDYAKVATFMKNNSATLDIVSEYTKMPLAQVVDFYNACYLTGLIEKRNQLEINKKKLSSERLNLLGKIDARLK